MKRIPEVSVITVCYNAEQTIRQVLSSVLRQTFRDYQYVLKDGGSTDRTNEIIKEYKKRFMEKGIELIHVSGRDGGIYQAMNEGVQLSAGRYVCFMNADDRFYDQEVLKRVFGKSGSRTAGILYGDALEYEFGKYYYFPKQMDKIETKMPFNHQASFVKRELMLTYPFHSNYRIGADYDFLLTAYQAGVEFEDTGVLVCVISKEGLSTVDLKNTFVESAAIRRKHGIVQYTEKEYKKKLFFTIIKQFGMDYFPKWLKYLIRQWQRKARGQKEVGL